MLELEKQAKTKWLEIVKQKGWKGYSQNEFDAFVMGLKVVGSEIQKLKEIHLREIMNLEHENEILEGQITEIQQIIKRLHEVLGE